MSDLGAIVACGVIAIVGIAGASRTSTEFLTREEGWLGAFVVYSLATLTLIPALLARVGLLTRGMLVGVGVVAGVVGAYLVVRWWRRNVGLHVGKLLAVAGVALVLSAPQLLSIVARPDSVPVSTPWYFWGLTVDYADEGEVPETSVEFGVETSALTDYTGFNAGGAALSLFAGGADGIHAAQIMRAIAVIGTALGFILLARAWGASFVAAVAGGGVIMSLAYLAGKLSSYRPEGFGYPLMLIVPAFVLVYVRTHDRSTLVAAAVGVAALSQIHGVSLTVGGALVAATLATRLPAMWRRRRPEITAVALAAGLIVAVWLGTDLALSERFTQGGMATQVPEISANGADPTLEFFRAVRTFPEDPLPISGFEVARSALDEGFYLEAGHWAEGVVYALVVAVAIAIVVFAVVMRVGGIGTALGFAAGAIGILVAISLVFQIGWETYVPRRTGWHRFLGQALLFVPLLPSVALGLAGRMRCARVGLVAWAVVAALAFGVTAKPLYDIHDTQPSREALGLLRSLDFPEDAVISTNAYSEGFVATVLERDALTNGRGPYHQADLLDIAIEQLDDARAFYADPIAEREYLDESDITHVLVATEPWMFGSTQHYPTDYAALYRLPELRDVRAGPGFLLFEVAR